MHINQRRGNALKRTYGMTWKEYKKLFSAQNKRCAICGIQSNIESLGDGTEKIDLFVDHCHTKGHIRGLLCSSCNSGLGFFKDDTDVLTKAIEYLNHTKENPVQTVRYKKKAKGIAIKQQKIADQAKKDKDELTRLQKYLDNIGRCR